VARGLIRAIYYTCAFLVRWVLRLCHAPAPVTSTVMGSSHSLGQLSVAHPDVVASPEAETEEGEATVEEQVVEDILEDVEVGMEGSVEDREVELEDSVSESDGGEKRDERSSVAEDIHLECWEWPHDWEDLDWNEEMWLEDERGSADLNEAVLPDESWE
jgi:hypothetical protein